MENNNDYQAQGQAPSQDAPTSAPQQTGKPEAPVHPNKFFVWIRESHVERTNNRVIAGVCGGLAQELGWNVTLIRVLMMILTFFGGLGAIFYGICWLLLPDASDHQILAEEIVAGRWDWSFIGVILCLAIALVGGFRLFPWEWGWFHINLTPTLFAALFFYLAIDHGRRRLFAAPMNRAPQQQPTMPPTGAPNPMGTPVQASQPYNTYSQQAQPVPPAAPNEPQHNVGAVPPMQPMPNSNAYVNAQTNPAPEAVTAQPLPYAMPAPAAQPLPRRKPAGPYAVLITMSAIFLLCAAFMIFVPRQGWVTAIAQPWILFTGIVCTGLGALVTIYGIIGRRAGGLQPLTWIAMILAVFVCIGSTAFSTGYTFSMKEIEHYRTITIADTNKTIQGSTKADMSNLEHGINIVGSNYDTSKATINLSDYAKHNKPTTVRLHDGSTAQSNCPTGTIRLAASDSQVTIIIPDGCSFSFYEHGGYSTPVQYVYGGKSSFLAGKEGRGYVAIFPDNMEQSRVLPYQSMSTTDEDYALWNAQCAGVETDENSKVNVNGNKEFSNLVKEGKYWPCAPFADKAPDHVQLIISPAFIANASIRVQYASQQ